MKKTINILLPLLIGLAVAVLLYMSIGWWGFWVIFPWIGFSISTGMAVSEIKISFSRQVS
ncbi:MAG: hypothetical protein K8R41_00520 [Bacteroidales bacterium]|nr:hypothetical protein [Bacteroidales bacterium]